MEYLEDTHVWGIHTTDDFLFLNKNIIALGWPEFGDCTALEATREAYKNHYLICYPDAKKGSIATSAGMLYRFTHEMAIGDFVVFPSKIDRKINIGRIESDFIYNTEDHMYPQQRKVTWLKHLPRTCFSQGALYEVGATMTFFSIKNYADEYLNALEKNFKSHSVEKEVDITVGPTANEIKEATQDFILKELSKNLKGYDFEGFVADLLHAMGYHCKISAHGGDSGIDITAYKDELPPRIVVQVKSQDADIPEMTLQALNGAMSPGDYGLFVTLSNYTKNAQIYLERNPIIKGIDGAGLVELILKYYELLSEKYQNMIPLKKVYIPISTI